MIRVAASDLDQMIWFRRIESMTDDDLVARLRRQSEIKPEMLAGTAWHDLLENHPGGDLDFNEIQHMGFTFRLDLGSDNDPIVLPQVREVFGRAVIDVDGEPVEIRCRVDGLSGNVVEEYKTTAKTDAEKFYESFQWRAYLLAFHADAVRYTLFKKWQRGFLVKIQSCERLVLYRHPGMEDVVRRAVSDLVNYCDKNCPDVIGR